MTKFRFLRFSNFVTMLFVVVLLATPFLALAQAPLLEGVCNGPDCNFCHLFLLLHKIINFLIYTLAMPIGALLFAWAGILYITAAGNNAQTGRAKKIFADVLLGIVIAVIAALAIDLILRTFTKQGLVPWTEFKCEATQSGGTTTAPPPPPTGVPPPPPPDGRDVFLQNKESQELLSTLPAVQWQSNASGECFDGRGDQVGVGTNRAELSAGVPLTVCASGCNKTPFACKPGAGTLNPNVQGVFILLGQEGVGFTVSSLATGSHSKTSAHYALRAADIVLPSVSYADLLARIKALPAVSDAYCENPSGKIACTDSSVNHIHFEVK